MYGTHWSGVYAPPHYKPHLNIIPRSLQSFTLYLPFPIPNLHTPGTPLLYAVRLGAPALCSRLIATGASVTDCAMQPSGNGPLHLAALQGDVACTRILVRKRASEDDDAGGGGYLVSLGLLRKRVG